MNSGEYIAVVLVLCGIVVFVLADKLIAVRRTVGRQEVIINHQIARHETYDCRAGELGKVPAFDF